MSINSVNDDPTGPDTVTVNDGEDAPESQPNPGTDTLDPSGVSITHMPNVSKGRDARGLPGMLDALIRRHTEGSDPDAAFKDTRSGTDKYPDRWTRDEALQVRPLVPTSFDTYQVAVTTAAPVWLAAERPERMTIILYNNGANTAYVGRNSGGGTPSSGFPIPAGGTLFLDATCSYVVSCVAGSPTTVAVLDQFRTDNDVN